MVGHSHSSHREHLVLQIQRGYWPYQRRCRVGDSLVELGPMGCLNSFHHCQLDKTQIHGGCHYQISNEEGQVQASMSLNGVNNIIKISLEFLNILNKLVFQANSHVIISFENSLMLLRIHV